MSIENDIPNFNKTMLDNSLSYSVVDELLESLEGISLRCADDSADKIKNIVNGFASIIPCGQTTNWGYDFILSDLRQMKLAIKTRIREKDKYNILFDCLALLVERFGFPLSELNQILKENNINDLSLKKTGQNYKWILGNEKTDLPITQEAKNRTKSTSRQAHEEISNVIQNINSMHDDRLRKENVRRALNAMEAVVKEYGNSNNINQAINKIKESKQYGPDYIVKEGISIFHNIQEYFPDLRHGTLDSERKEMSQAEAVYWINKICTYIVYICDMHTVIS